MNKAYVFRRRQGRRLKLVLESRLVRSGGNRGLCGSFSGPFARQGLLHAFLLAGLQVVRVALYLFNDVFRLDFTFKPAQRVFQRSPSCNRTSAKLFLRAK